MAKILHIADVHLDSPFSLLDPQKSQARRNELRGTFTSAMMYAKEAVLMQQQVFIPLSARPAEPCD